MYELQFAQDYVRKVEKKGNPDDLTPDEIEEMARIYGKYEVRREKKHFKAFMKGASAYKFLGQPYPVLTSELLSKSSSFNDLVNEKRGESEADTTEEEE